MRTAILTFVLAASVLLTASITVSGADTPGKIVIDSISYEYEAVTYDHSMHEMYAGDCGTCHHRHGNSAALPCGDCHSIDSESFKTSVTHNFLSCRACHGEYSVENPEVPGLKVAYHRACFKCHRGMGNIGADPKGCTEKCHAKRS